MKQIVLIPLMATSVLMGCQQQAEQLKETAAIESEKQVAAWVGKYQGTTPCMGCVSRCEDCPGMAVKLDLNEDMTYTLVRESLSGHNEIETIHGVITFTDPEQTQLELKQVTTRNLMVVDLAKQQLEIREDVSAKKYQMQNDFILAKKA